MLDDLGNFWAESAKQFEGIDGILGYEIMNVLRECTFWNYS